MNMNRITVLYDARCGLCRLARQWVEAQAKFLEVEFLAAEGAEAHRRYPTLASRSTPEDFVVIDDERGVYRDGAAWVMVLYALEDYRAWSLRLGSPRLLPLARQAFRLLSHERARLSRWLRLETEEHDLIAGLRAEGVIACELVPVPTGLEPSDRGLSQDPTRPEPSPRPGRLPSRGLWTRSFG